jgi:hypothetical protein
MSYGTTMMDFISSIYRKVKNASNHGYMTRDHGHVQTRFYSSQNCHNVVYTIDSSRTSEFMFQARKLKTTNL